MSLILTQLSRFGIIHASDSQLTESIGNVDKDGGLVKKVFEIPYLQAGLSIAGSFVLPLYHFMV